MSASLVTHDLNKPRENHNGLIENKKGWRSRKGNREFLHGRPVETPAPGAFLAVSGSAQADGQLDVATLRALGRNHRTKAGAMHLDRTRDLIS